MIEIALHYGTRGGQYRDGDFSAPAVLDAMQAFVFWEMLLPHYAPGEAIVFPAKEYQATDRLRAYVEHLCAVQLPVIKWVQPTAGHEGTP